MDPDGKRAYVSDGNANGLNPAAVRLIDVQNDTCVRSIVLRPPAQVMPTAIDITPDGGTLLVVSGVWSAARVEPAVRPRGVKVSYGCQRVLE